MGDTLDDEGVVLGTDGWYFTLSGGGYKHRKTGGIPHGVTAALGTENGWCFSLSDGSLGHRKRVVVHIEWRRYWAPKTSDASHGVVSVLGTQNGWYSTWSGGSAWHGKRVIVHMTSWRC